jgi:hypothetical protein
MSKNNHLIIGFDLDGVIIDHTDNRLKLAKKLGFNLEPPQTHPEVIEGLIPEEILEALKNELYHDPAIALSAPLMPGAKEILERFQGEDRPIFLISRRKKSDLAVRLLEQYGIWPNYFNEKNSFFVSRPEDKNVKAIELGITHYIDDEIKVLRELNYVRHRFLFDQFRNQAESDFYRKINSWEDFLNHI